MRLSSISFYILLITSSDIHWFKPKTPPLEASAWSVFGLNEWISLEGF